MLFLWQKYPVLPNLFTFVVLRVLVKSLRFFNVSPLTVVRVFCCLARMLPQVSSLALLHPPLLMFSVVFNFFHLSLSLHCALKNGCQYSFFFHSYFPILTSNIVDGTEIFERIQWFAERSKITQCIIIWFLF